MVFNLRSIFWLLAGRIRQRKSRENSIFNKKGSLSIQSYAFGLCNPPATFERLMEKVLSGLHWRTCLVYLDDIIVCGKTFEDMLKNLGEVFDRLETPGLKLKAKKCQLFLKRVNYIGHVISTEGISTDPTKVDMIKELQLHRM